MTHHPDDATESWSMCRTAFARRAAHVPEIGLIHRLIDWIIDQGFSTLLYPSCSLDNLVISDATDWRKESQKILVIPKKSTVELRLYTRGKLVDQREVGFDHLYEELDRLLPKLLPDDKQS